MTARVVPDMPEADYHAHPALSHSGIKTLLRSPAHYKWERDNGGRPDTDAMRIGRAFHTITLGNGPDVRTLDADSWRTKDAKAFKEAAAADGATPLVTSEWQQVDAMAAAVHAHPIASALLKDGTAEQSLFTTDPTTGVNLRGRLDWTTTRGGRALCVDLKSTIDGNPAGFGKTAANFHYTGQAAMYLDLMRDCGIDDDAVFLFVLVEKTPPYLVSVVELDHEAVATGRRENRHAIDLYARCVETDTWPGYDADDIPLISLPRWYRELGEAS